MRRILVIVLVLLVVVVGLFFLAAANVNRYHDQIQAQVQKKLNRPVTLGHLGLRLFPLSVSVAGLTVAEDPAFQSSRPFAAADNVFISVGLFSLLRGNIAVDDLTLSQPKIELIRNASGIWNYSSLGSADHSKASSSSDFSLGQLKVVDGQIGYTNLMAKEPRAVYDHIDVDLRNFSPHRQFDLTLDAHLPGQGKQLLSFKGKVGPIPAESSSATPINGHVTAEELTLSSLNRLSPGLLPSGDDGVATVSTDVSTEGQRILLKGDLKLENAVLQGKKLGFPISSHYDVLDDRSTDVIQVKPSSIGLGQTSFNLNGTANTSAKPGTVNMHLATHDSSIEELAKLAAAAGVASNMAYQVKGVLSADITASGPTSGPQLSGTLDARTLSVSGGEIKQPVTIPAIHVTLSPQAIQSNPFDAQSGSTVLNAQFALSQYQTLNRAIDATLKTNNANITDLLDMAKAYGIDASQGASASGRLTLNVHAQGPLANISALKIAGNGQIVDAQISSPALNKPVAVHSANLQFAQNSFSVSNLNSTIGGTGLTGNFTAKNFSAPQIQFALAADKIDTADLQNLTEKSSTPAAPHKGALPSNQPSLIDRTTGSGTLSANSIQAQNILLTNVHATCKLDRGLIQLSPVTADLFGGKEAGTIGINVRNPQTALTVKSKLSGIDSNALLSSVSSLHDTLYGRLSADTNLSFTLESATADLARTLNGTLGFDLANGQLKNVNILNEIAKVGKFLNRAPAQASGTGTDLTRLSGTLDIKDGLASTNNLVAALSAGSLSANGSINLVTQGLDLHMNAVLNSGTSQSVGGSGIGGFLDTALANNKGQLVLPVLVTGSTAHPIITPDVQALAKMKLKNLLPTAGDPGRLTSGLVGAIAGKQGPSGILNQVLGGGQQKQGGNSTSNPQDNNPIGSLLQDFGKKKPK